jgi:hypothetical protein
MPHVTDRSLRSVTHPDRDDSKFPTSMPLKLPVHDRWRWKHSLEGRLRCSGTLTRRGLTRSSQRSGLSELAAGCKQS